MPRRYTSSTWKTPAANQHFCELHHDEACLVTAIADYAFQGLMENEAVVLVTSAVRQENIVTLLAQKGIDVADVTRRGWLMMSDPAAFREQLFVDGLPCRERYRAAMDEIVSTATRNGRRRMRVYADLVDTLWREGNHEAVRVMEEVSEEYCIEHRLKAFCGYVLDSFALSSYHPVLEDVCRRHCRVAPTGYDERIRAAVDAASNEVVGIVLSHALRHARAQSGWHDRLPLARRTVLWLKSNMAGRAKRVMERAREIFEGEVFSGR